MSSMIDILFFAVIAIVIFGRLWQVLGQRNENDPSEGKGEKKSRLFQEEDEDDVVVISDKARDFVEPPKPAVIAPLSLAGTLQRIKEKDAAFDEKKFLEGAKTAFSMILNAYVHGEIALVSSLLGADVEAKFKQAILSRQKAGQVLEHQLNEIREAEVEAAELTGNEARVTVRFLSRQTNILRDARGEVVSGAPGRMEDIEDIWVFFRDLTSPNPNWSLIETRS